MPVSSTMLFAFFSEKLQNTDMVYQVSTSKGRAESPPPGTWAVLCLLQLWVRMLKFPPVFLCSCCLWVSLTTPSQAGPEPGRSPLVGDPVTQEPHCCGGKACSREGSPVLWFCLSLAPSPCSWAVTVHRVPLCDSPQPHHSGSGGNPRLSGLVK